MGPHGPSETDACFIVRDANGLLSRTSPAGARDKLLTRDEARRIAANIAKLVEAVLTSALYPAPDALWPTQVSDLLLMSGKPIAVCPACDDRALPVHSCT